MMLKYENAIIHKYVDKVSDSEIVGNSCATHSEKSSRDFALN